MARDCSDGQNSIHAGQPSNATERLSNAPLWVFHACAATLFADLSRPTCLCGHSIVPPELLVYHGIAVGLAWLAFICHPSPRYWWRLALAAPVILSTYVWCCDWLIALFGEEH
ncbi:MAG: hypothetical protein ACKVX7_00760 [Planctomycetota bacterium]